MGIKGNAEPATFPNGEFKISNRESIFSINGLSSLALLFSSSAFAKSKTALAASALPVAIPDKDSSMSVLRTSQIFVTSFPAIFMIKLKWLSLLY